MVLERSSARLRRERSGRPSEPGSSSGRNRWRLTKYANQLLSGVAGVEPPRPPLIQTGGFQSVPNDWAELGHSVRVVLAANQGNLLGDVPDAQLAQPLIAALPGKRWPRHNTPMVLYLLGISKWAKSETEVSRVGDWSNVKTPVPEPVKPVALILRLGVLLEESCDVPPFAPACDDVSFVDRFCRSILCVIWLFVRKVNRSFRRPLCLHSRSVLARVLVRGNNPGKRRSPTPAPAPGGEIYK